MNSKSRKFSLLIIVLFCGSLLAWAQLKNDVNSSLGNAEMMRYNLNEPNAVNPADNNDQRYERKHSPPIETEHPDKDWANTYSRGNYESKK